MLKFLRNLFRKPSDKELWEKVLHYYTHKYTRVYLCMCISEMRFKHLISDQQATKLTEKVTNYLGLYSTLEGYRRSYPTILFFRREMRINLIQQFIKDSK